MSRQSDKESYQEGVRDERLRVLDCINELAIRINAKVNTKLMTQAEEHLVNLRIKIAEAIFIDLRKAITYGLHATPRSTQESRLHLPSSVAGKEEPKGRGEPMDAHSAPGGGEQAQRRDGEG